MNTSKEPITVIRKMEERKRARYNELRLEQLEASHARLVAALEGQKRFLTKLGYSTQLARVTEALAEAKALSGEAE